MISAEFELTGKFCIHYWLDNESHGMNAGIQNKCEYEYLGLIREFGKLLDVEIFIETLPLEEGGLVRWFSILRRKAIAHPQVSTAVLTAFITAIFVTPIAKMSEKFVEKLFEDNEMTELQKEKLRLEIDKLRRDSISAIPSNVAIKKRRSNFYETLSKEVKVYEVSYLATDDSSSKIGEEKFVKRNEFASFVLVSDDIEPDLIQNATIELVAPVLKKGKYRWLGIFNQQTIPFSMKSANFKQQVQNGEIEFKNGSIITCLLQINKKLDNEGQEIVIGYEVLRVDKYTENGELKETNEGISYRRRIKENRMQVSLFEENTDE